MKFEELETTWKPKPSPATLWQPSMSSVQAESAGVRSSGKVGAYDDFSARRLPGGTNCACGDGTCIDCVYYAYYNIYE